MASICVSCVGIGAMVIAAGSAQSFGASAFPPSINLSSLNGNNGFVISGINGYDQSGYSVSSAGDINGDGIDDILIGAPGVDVTYFVGSSGAAYVVFGGPGVGASGSLTLASLVGVNGFVINGIGDGDNAGYSVSGAGDVNGDGIADILVGARFASPGGREQAGATYVVFGGPLVGASGTLDLSSLNGANGVTLNGADAHDFSGASVCSAGDVNGDGIDDLLIGAFGADLNGLLQPGESYVVFGRVDNASTGTIELSTLDGTNGFVIHGIDEYDDSGLSVASAGDFNGDGFQDMLIGAPYADPNGLFDAGEAYLVFGGVDVGAGGTLDLSSLDGTNGFVINGMDVRDLCGRAVSSAGDVNGDGYDDILVGARGADPNGKSYAGETYVLFGGPTVGAAGFLNLYALSSSEGFVCTGADSGDESGFTVSPAGDVNEDGIDDILIGARYADPNGTSYAGELFVVLGRNTTAAGPFPVSLDLGSLNGVNGFVCRGIDASDFCGWSTGSAGDINGDGVGDIVIGAMGADPNGQTFAGETYVVFGRAPSCAGDINGDGKTSSLDFNILAAWFGLTVPPGPTGDLNHDGVVNTADFNILAGDFGCGS